MAEGAPLLREYTLIAYRGFESLLLRHLNKNASLAEAFLFKGRVGGQMRTLGFDQMRSIWHRAAKAAKPEGAKQPKGCFESSLLLRHPIKSPPRAGFLFPQELPHIS